ncbi:peptide-methionine (S)-S-oxide reductase MsrA [Rhodopila globiformis]|uniref:Peptide methionine sulfoxide reductase MsrA n=1 Tax=Rhodopila globiformis TaxID=1071 RepID=A0A2S6NJ79_RHOGL|nr:peptide-methionine (S)-S-oxide reductase MsrA [Rhodopila globiformis]PPQ34791.1 peptide-methionine (S)-S-oxide reductase [Rhodopila globiformis]
MRNTLLRSCLLASGAAALAIGLLPLSVSRAEEQPRLLPPPALHAAQPHGLQSVVLAGGCFWGVQGVFQHVRGVEDAVSGYAGGAKATADYETVSTGTTGHAESVRVTYDPARISYGEILRIYFSVVLDPTEVNRQGPDVGTQYRSEIFATSPEQAQVARAYIAQLDQAHAFSRPIATQVSALNGFYPAEAYHQDYLFHHPDNPYIAWNDLPKLRALQRLFPDRYVEKPVLVSRPPA